MRHKIINSKSCRNQKSCNNLQHKCRKDVVLAAIFRIAFLDVKHTKYRILSDRFELSTHKFISKQARGKYRLKFKAKFNILVSTQDKCTHFSKKSYTLLCSAPLGQCLPHEPSRMEYYNQLYLSMRSSWGCV